MEGRRRQNGGRTPPHADGGRVGRVPAESGERRLQVLLLAGQQTRMVFGASLLSAATPQCAPLHLPRSPTAPPGTRRAPAAPTHTLHDTCNHELRLSGLQAGQQHSSCKLQQLTRRFPPHKPACTLRLGQHAGQRHARRHAGHPGETAIDDCPACTPEWVSSVYAIMVLPAGLLCWPWTW